MSALRLAGLPTPSIVANCADPAVLDGRPFCLMLAMPGMRVDKALEHSSAKQVVEAAIRALKRSGIRPRSSIELVLLTSEEPTRFGIGCVGSRLISGTLDPERADMLKGAQRGSEEETLAQVRTAAGFSGPLSGVRLPSGHYHVWVELHIEQGPLLEREGLPVTPAPASA